MIEPESWTEWRYSGRGRVKHAVEARTRLCSPTRGPYLWPLCDQLPGAQDDEYEYGDTRMHGWLGATNAKEVKKLVELPYCKNCVFQLSLRAEE